MVRDRVLEEMPAGCEAVIDLVHDYARRLEPLMAPVFRWETRRRLRALRVALARAARGAGA